MTCSDEAAGAGSEEGTGAGSAATWAPSPPFGVRGCVSCRKGEGSPTQAPPKGDLPGHPPPPPPPPPPPCSRNARCARVSCSERRCGAASRVSQQPTPRGGWGLAQGRPLHRCDRRGRVRRWGCHSTLLLNRLCGRRPLRGDRRCGGDGGRHGRWTRLAPGRRAMADPPRCLEDHRHGTRAAPRSGRLGVRRGRAPAGPDARRPQKSCASASKSDVMPSRPGRWRGHGMVRAVAQPGAHQAGEAPGRVPPPRRCGSRRTRGPRRSRRSATGAVICRARRARNVIGRGWMGAGGDVGVDGDSRRGDGSLGEARGHGSCGGGHQRRMEGRRHGKTPEVEPRLPQPRLQRLHRGAGTRDDLLAGRVEVGQDQVGGVLDSSPPPRPGSPGPPPWPRPRWLRRPGPPPP